MSYLDQLVTEIATSPICEPGPDQYVDRCHFSRAGWAIHELDGRCTCRPALAPQERAAP